MFASIISNTRERGRFLRFSIVGAIGAVVDFGSYTLLNDVLGVPEVISSVISFVAAVISNFTWNRYWTYPDSRSKAVSRQVFQFGVVSVIGLVIRTPIFALLERALSQLILSLPTLPDSLAGFLGDKIALAVAVIVVMFWNFFVNRYWTYSDVS